ncbi:glycosyltransferase family 4 protein [Leptolyngbya sp. FACHB-36]|uniref:glycosyltransferase family 4 protein n=1 Tax=Leptolyngbya sp. FACHB-36 TaxID=2692808 RepID=UPI001680AB9D|nr:glycosyltransferase family 1 protein [Leptolyngbya sp. FACHB-36]MBD2021841.1 glycosyltransferase family 4 protein [Leptolyngbya sp. FACHB-36]
MSSPFLVNLSFLSNQPTGLSVYAANLFPHLKALQPTLLSAALIDGFNCYPVPAGMTPDQGKLGHLRRLLWTQVQLPKIYQQLQSRLLFSPITEAPLNTACRFVVTVHDFIALRFPDRFSPLTVYHRYYIPQVLQQAQHILCVSQATADDLVQFWAIPASKITPIPLAYDAKVFRFLDLPTKNFFLYVGRLDPYKNVQRLISAFAALPSRCDYELWIAGPPDRRYLPTLVSQVEDLGITPHVKFLNYVPREQLPILMNQAIALVFPSLWEGFGLPVLEAMACGAPVITSNCSSLPEVAGDSAILVDPYRVEAIAEAMQTVATNATLWSHYRSAGLARASQISWTTTGQATVQVLKPFLEFA